MIALRTAALALLFAVPAAARERLGNFATWSAFCDGPRRCYAISVPAEERGSPYVRVAVDGPTPRLQAHVGRAARRATLLIGDDRFDLTLSDMDATADPALTRRIVAAMRREEAMTLVARTQSAGTVRHHYSLAGAPSAIDAAAIGSVRR